MICCLCNDSGMIDRPLVIKKIDRKEIRHTVEGDISFPSYYEWTELVELGGIDACPACTKISEIEWIHVSRAIE